MASESALKTTALDLIKKQPLLTEEGKPTPERKPYYNPKMELMRRRKAESNRRKQIVEEALPEILGSKDIGAAVVAAGHQMSDVWRGIAQWTGREEEMGLGSKREEADNEKMMNYLYGSDYGGSAMVGAISGALLEPISAIVGGGLAKGAKIAGVLDKTRKAPILTGSAIGAAHGASTYVDPESGLNRMQTTLIGAALGGTLGAGLKGGRKYRDHLAIKEKRGVEKEYARRLVAGETPKQARQEVIKEVGSDRFRTIKRKTGDYPNFNINTVEEAQTFLKGPEGKKILPDILTESKGYKKIAHKGKIIGKSVDTALGIMSTRIGNLSQPIMNRTRRTEAKIRRLQNTYRTRHDNLLKLTRTIEDSFPVDAKELAYALRNEEWQDAINIMSKHAPEKEIRKEMSKLRQTTNKLADQQVELGLMDAKDKVDYFWSFRINDRAGLLEAIGKDSSYSPIKKAIGEAKKRAKNKNEAFTELDEDRIINNFMSRKRVVGKGKASYRKQRSTHNISHALLDFYHKPSESLKMYFMDAAHDIEVAKFFGKEISRKKTKGKTKTKTAFDSKGVLRNPQDLATLLRKYDPNLSHEQLNELANLMHVRFGAAEVPPNEVNSMIKNLLYASTIANPFTALVQLGDVGVSIYMNGWKNTILSVAETVLGKNKITVKDMGLVDGLAEELMTRGMTQSFLRKMLRYSGFETMDRFGKSTYMNAALKKITKEVNNPQKLMDMKIKYAGMFSPQEFGQLVRTIKEGRTDHLVRDLMFAELSKVQPISKIETPELFQKHPNARMIYMLKSFMLKQVDVLRNTAWKDMKEGRADRGMLKAMYYVMLMGTMGASVQTIKQGLAGDPNIGDHMSPMGVVTSAFKHFGLTEYSLKDIEREGITRAGIEYMMPPLNVIDAYLMGLVNSLLPEDQRVGSTTAEDTLRNVPLVGSVLHKWFVKDWDQ